jgi:hypothetical protein
MPSFTCARSHRRWPSSRWQRPFRPITAFGARAISIEQWRVRAECPPQPPVDPHPKMRAIGLAAAALALSGSPTLVALAPASAWPCRCLPSLVACTWAFFLQATHEHPMCWPEYYRPPPNSTGPATANASGGNGSPMPLIIAVAGPWAASLTRWLMANGKPIRTRPIRGRYESSSCVPRLRIGLQAVTTRVAILRP